jgi:ribonucleoside-triphosphate reductase
MSLFPKLKKLERRKMMKVKNDNILLVEKNDKRKEIFSFNKLFFSIYNAAQEIGYSDKELFKKLTKEVVELLERENNDHLITTEMIRKAVEKVLSYYSYDDILKVYNDYQRRKMFIKETTQKKLPFTSEVKEATDFALFVQTSLEKIEKWDKNKIINALVRETSLNEEVAEEIAQEVEDFIKKAQPKIITTSLIRELVNTKLIERGLYEIRKKHQRLGIPLYDVEKILFYRNKENANTPHCPEGTNLTLAEAINKQYALEVVYSEDVANSHIYGDIHIHDLGFINRPYCSGQSIEYVKKFGLSLPGALSIAKPAKHPETLLAHMVKFSAALQGHFAGAIGWDAVNIFFAPFLVGMSDKDLYQLAQMLIFEYSQQNVARGGQAIFSDLNLYWEIPAHFENTPAIGPGGEYTGKYYKDYLKEAQRFLKAIFYVYLEGDGSNRPFFFPKPLVHITERFFQTEGYKEFLDLISEVASEKGNTYFVFDRGGTAKISECCRLAFKLDENDLRDAQQPWKMRYCALQNVTLNLPRIAYLSEHNNEKLFTKIEEFFKLAIKAHLQKKKFLENLLKLKDEGPLALLAMERDGEPYLRMHRVTYLIGILGLNEMIQYHLGKELHEDDEAFKFGLKVIAFLKFLCDKYSKVYNMRFVLEQTPAESCAYRLAKLDLEYYYEKAKNIVKGSISKDSVYYTNSTYLNISLPISPIERVYKEGKFHDLIEAGALTHIWLADTKPSKESIANFVIKTFYHTRNAQITFSPEFTTCNTCLKTIRGLKQICPYCQSKNVDHITRVTGYFSRVSAWNKGKKQELKDRYKGMAII